MGSNRRIPSASVAGGARHWGAGQGCIGREGASEVALEAVRQAVGGGCRSGWGRLQMPLKLALGVRETVAGHRQGALEGGSPPPPPRASNASLGVAPEGLPVAFAGRTQTVRILPCRGSAVPPPL